MVATNGHQPVVEDEVDVDVRAVDADVLHDAHVDDDDAAVRAARVVDLAQRVDEVAGLCGHALLPGSMTMRKPVVAVARAGSAGSARAARRPQPVSR